MTDTYLARRGERLTVHMLMDLMNGKTMEEVFEFKDKDSEAYRLGRAAHMMILEGIRYDREYVTGGPVNDRTGRTYGMKTKKYEDWAAQARLTMSISKAASTTFIRPEDHRMLCAMQWVISQHPAASELLREGGTPELTLRKDYSGIPCQSRLDWLSDHPYLVDLKTCESVDTFEINVKQYRYLNQMAFYREMLSEYPGIPIYLIAVDKTEEPRCLVMRLNERALSEAQEENEAKLAEIRVEFLEYREQYLSRKEDQACQLAQS